MAYFAPQNTLAARSELEKEAAEALAGLAHVLMIDYLRGWNGATERNIELAEKYWKEADEIDPSVALGHVAKGQILEVNRDLDGAIEELDRAIKLDPKLAIAYAHKANALILRGEAEKAPDLLTKAITSRDPDLGLLYWFMGRAYFNMRNYTDAIQWLKKSVQERPTTWFSWAHLISAYALTKQDGEPDAKAALDEYRWRFKADWPLSKIKDYYAQPKYRNRHPQLEAALEEYFKGLEDAKKKGFPP